MPPLTCWGTGSDHGIEEEDTVPIKSLKIWIDLDNTPHVPFFIPIIRELERRGHRVFLTARDAYQVCELADTKGLSYSKIGRHFGKRRAMKVAGVLWRSAQLLRFYLRHKPDLALSHGSRSVNFLGNLVRIPTVGLTDYENTRTIPFSNPRWLIVAKPLAEEGLTYRAGRLRSYRGIKEDVYVSDFCPDPSLLDMLGLNRSAVIVTVRPPAEEAHYHNPEADILLDEVMKGILVSEAVQAVLLPRNHRQEKSLRGCHPEWFAHNKTRIPSRPVDGLNLIWCSDLVVSGGGTMNREAAALKVPVYSIFRGKIGAVDRLLEREGRLTMIDSVHEVRAKIQFVKRHKSWTMGSEDATALRDIVGHIEDISRIDLHLPSIERL